MKPLPEQEGSAIFRWLFGVGTKSTANQSPSWENREDEPATGAIAMGRMMVSAEWVPAIGTAAAIPGTLVNLAAGGGERDVVTFGHPSGTLKVGAAASKSSGDWKVEKVTMSRSARVLMEGWVRVPRDSF